jgi:methionyl-tRNA formyltransferase
MKPLKIIFAGTPHFSLPCLQALQQSGHEICAVFTQPDRPAGRGQKAQASVIKQWALEKQLPVFQPETLKHEAIQNTIAELQADVMVVVAYGLILPQKVLDLPKMGCINVHASLLPRWRGAAPIQYAIHAGDEITGITIMQMDQGMDTGDILTQERCPILANDTSESLFHRLSLMGAKLLVSTLEKLQHHEIKGIPQNHEHATYASKITKTQAKINWQDTSRQICQNTRAYQPWPVAFTELASQVVKIHQLRIVHDTTPSKTQPGTIIAHTQDELWVKTGDGVVAIINWQWPNQKITSLKDWLIHKASLAPIGAMFS